MKGLKILGREVTDIDKAQLKQLELQKKLEEPIRPTIPIQEADALHIQSMLQDFPEARLAFSIAWILGQRIGDVMRLEQRGIGIPIKDPLTTKWNVPITFYVTKNVKKADPYTLHLPLQSTVGMELTEFTKKRSSSDHSVTHGKKPLLFQPNSIWHIRQCIHGMSKGFNLLSIRKGGLQNMAMKGVKDVKKFSRHTTEAMLQRYLDWGKADLAPAREAQAANLFSAW